jgi:hypothetical protein
MHPIERLRMVARAAGEGPALLAQEAAGALVAFGDDPAGLVTACRRLVDRQPTCGTIWWLAARVLSASDATAAAWAALDELEADPTPTVLADGLPDGVVVTSVGLGEQVMAALCRRGDVDVLVADVENTDPRAVRRLQRTGTVTRDVPLTGVSAAVEASGLVLIDADAAGPGGVVAPAGARAAAAVARHASVPVWAVAGVGRVLPGPLWDALAARLAADDEPWLALDEVVPPDLVDRVVGPAGIEEVAPALRRAGCPVAPELLKGTD